MLVPPMNTCKAPKQQTDCAGQLRLPVRCAALPRAAQQRVHGASEGCWVAQDRARVEQCHVSGGTSQPGESVTCPLQQLHSMQPFPRSRTPCAQCARAGRAPRGVNSEQWAYCTSTPSSLCSSHPMQMNPSTALGAFWEAPAALESLLCIYLAGEIP